jgi:hypothetical protein
LALEQVEQVDLQVVQVAAVVSHAQRLYQAGQVRVCLQVANNKSIHQTRFDVAGHLILEGWWLVSSPNNAATVFPVRHEANATRHAMWLARCHVGQAAPVLVFQKVGMPSLMVAQNKHVV